MQPAFGQILHEPRGDCKHAKAYPSTNRCGAALPRHRLRIDASQMPESLRPIVSDDQGRGGQGRGAVSARQRIPTQDRLDPSGDTTFSQRLRTLPQKLIADCAFEKVTALQRRL